jgi:transcriptional regulator with XRE-family HTH domain
MTPVGEELKLYRVLARLLQWRVAALAGISQTQLSLIERGRRQPSPELAERIRNAIEILKGRR